MANIKKRALSVEKPAAEKEATVPKQNQNKKKKLAVASNEQTKVPNKAKKQVANGKAVPAVNPNKKAAKQNQKQKPDKVAGAAAAVAPVQTQKNEKKKKQEPKKVVKDQTNSAEQVNKKAKTEATKVQNKDKPEGVKKSRSRKIQYTLEKFTVETLEAKIAEIKSKETLSKTAKRRLAALKKLLRVKQGGDAAPVNTSEDNKAQKAPKKPVNNKVAEAAKGKDKKTVDNKNQQKAKPQVVAVQKVNKVVPAKEDKKKENKKGEKVPKAQKKNLLLKSLKPEEEDDDDDDDDDSEPDDNEINAFNDSTDAVVDSEEDDSEDDDDDEDAEEEEDDDDEEEDKVKVTDKVKSQQPPKKAEAKDDKSGKNQRYVLFLGNLPYNVTPEDIKKHFLTKVSSVVSVRIPQKKGTDKPQGFGYIEFSNSEDYEKGLTLHNTFIGGRKLNVQYTTTGSKHISNKQDVVAKNKKLQALRQTGKLAGSKPNKNFAKKQRKA